MFALSLRLTLTGLCSALLCACTSAAPDAALGHPDASAPVDAGGTDAAAPDASAADAQEEDAGLEDSGVVEDAGGLAFVEEVYPLFEAQGCLTFACHGSMVSVGGVLVFMPDVQRAYADLIDRTSARGPEVLVRAGLPDESLLVAHSETTLLQFDILDEGQAALIREWVAEGAVFQRGGEAPDGGVSDGGQPASCTLENARGWPELPQACLPRCTTATWDQVVACRTAADVLACQDMAIDADTSTAVNLAGLTDPLDIGCRRCLDWQTGSCLTDLCPDALLAFNRCSTFRIGDPCTAQLAAVNTCAARADVRACRITRERACSPP